MMDRDLQVLIDEHRHSFSKGQRLIAAYILDHYDKAAFMTALKLGQTVGVSESTVVRFATLLGYDGYPRLQRAMQEMIRNRLTAVQRMEVTESQIGSGDVLKKVLQTDMDKIRRTLDELSPEEFGRATDAVIAAKEIYILGIRSSAALARFLSFYFNLIFHRVRFINTTSASEMFEQMLRIGEGDLLIAISFPRYSRRTIKAATFAKSRGAQVIAVTDCAQSPLAAQCDIKLLARSDMASFVDSLVAPMSLLNALIVSVGLRRRKEVSQMFCELETIWDEYDVYEKSPDETENRGI